MPAIQKTDAALNLLRDGSRGTQNPKVTYVAVGSGSATPLSTDTQLQNEVFRKTITSYTVGTTGDITVNATLGNSDAVGANIQEVGFFGGNATGTRNSGVLVARGLFTIGHNKLASESVPFSLDITFS
jgi:hypothetical protein